VVESTALEMRHTGNRIVGSNPTLSAMTLLVQWIETRQRFSSSYNIRHGMRCICR
jgi:hypothetical protein